MLHVVKNSLAFAGVVLGALRPAYTHAAGQEFISFCLNLTADPNSIAFAGVLGAHLGRFCWSARHRIHLPVQDFPLPIRFCWPHDSEFTRFCWA